MTSKGQKKKTNVRGRPDSPKNVTLPNAQASSGSSSSSSQKPVATSSQHPSKRTKTSSATTMDVDAPVDTLQPEQQTPLINLEDSNASAPLDNVPPSIISSEIAADLNSINDMSGSSGNTVNPNVDNGKRAEDPIANADPNAMIVDQQNKDDQEDKETEQQEFSLRVGFTPYINNIRFIGEIYADHLL